MCIDSTSQETREKEIERKRNKEEVSGDEGRPTPHGVPIGLMGAFVKRFYRKRTPRATIRAQALWMALVVIFV